MTLKSKRKDSAYSTTASLSDYTFDQETKFNQSVVADSAFNKAEDCKTVWLSQENISNVC